MTQDGVNGGLAAAYMLAVYAERFGDRVPSGDVPTSWRGVEAVAALLADLRLYVDMSDGDWWRTLEVADELYAWDADPMGAAAARLVDRRG
jgi:hypothetical protein